MGISAAKTIVITKGEVPEENTTTTDVKAESFEELSARLRNKQSRKLIVQKVEEKKINPIMEWRAEKTGKKSSFLQDILTHNE